MRRAIVFVVAIATPSCAIVAGLNKYDEIDCIEPMCGDSSAAAETTTSDGAPSSETDAVTPAIDTAPPSDSAPACTPIASSSVTIGTWSIDATEVTNAQYAAFLAAKGTDTSGQRAACSWNTGYRPAVGWPAPPERCNHPVVRVDWCDADAYCKWAGKRLCGSPSGGPASYSGFATISTSQWFAACSRSAGSRYLYGATYVAGACVDDAYDGKTGVATTDVLRRVREAPNCRGSIAPYDALYDMNGNVFEWEDSCNDSEGNDDDCRIRGGSYLEAGDKTDCDEGRSLKRGQTADDVGFRCCSP